MLGPRRQVRERACRCGRRGRCISVCLKRPRVPPVRAWPCWRRRAGARLSDVRRRSAHQVDRGSQCARETAYAQDEQDKSAPRALGTTSFVGGMVLALESPRDSELAILGVELTANRIDFRPVTLREERSVVFRSAALPRPPTGIHPISVLTRQGVLEPSTAASSGPRSVSLSSPQMASTAASTRRPERRRPAHRRNFVSISSSLMGLSGWPR
jgi:hypothetical protein